MKYRRKEIIDAVQWNGKNQSEIKTFAGQFAMFDYADMDKDGTLDPLLKVKTSVKIENAATGDYIVRGSRGDYSIINKADFEALYEEAK